MPVIKLDLNVLDIAYEDVPAVFGTQTFGSTTFGGPGEPIATIKLADGQTFTLHGAEAVAANDVFEKSKS
jgi:hypothetical protein